jgi:hypothetical protein
VYALSSCYGGRRMRLIAISTATVTTVASYSTNGIDYPFGIAASNDFSYALIADYNNGYIRKLDLLTYAASIFAGSGVLSSNNGVGTSASFNQPRHITFSSDESYVIITTVGCCIRKLVISTATVTTLAGSGAIGSRDGIGTYATFDVPSGILLSSDDSVAFISDRNNNIIRRMVMSTGRVSTLMKTASAVALNYPDGLMWLEQDSVLLVAEYSGNRIQQVYGTCAEPTGSPSGRPSTSMPTIYTAPEGLFCGTVSQVVVAGTGSPGSVDAVGTTASMDLMEYQHPLLGNTR